MLISILGNKGSGKTLLTTIIALESKRMVYSNYWIDMENYKPLEVIDFLNLPNDVDVIMDEGYTWLEARTSSSFLNRYLSYINLQSRKRTIDIYLTAQMFSTIDLRFREQSDVIVKCRHRLRETSDFFYSFLRVETEQKSSFLLKYQDAKTIFDKYDTYEIVEPHAKEMLELRILESDPVRLWDRISKIGDSIKRSLKEITHDRVKASLMKNGYNVGYEPLVYVYLKDLEK